MCGLWLWDQEVAEEGNWMMIVLIYDTCKACKVFPYSFVQSGEFVRRSSGHGDEDAD